MESLTENARYYLEVFKNSFLKDEDYEYFMKWLSHKINHNESINQGIIMYSPHMSFKDFCINMFKNINPKLCSDDDSNGKGLNDKYSIIKLHFIDDALERRIYYCYSLNEYQYNKIIPDDKKSERSFRSDERPRSERFRIKIYENGKEVEKEAILERTKNKCDWYITTNSLDLVKNPKIGGHEFKVIQRCPIYKKSEIADCPYLNKMIIINDNFKLNDEDIKSIYEYIENYE